MKRLIITLALIAAGCAPSVPQNWTNPDLAALDRPEICTFDRTGFADLLAA